MFMLYNFKRHRFMILHLVNINIVNTKIKGFVFDKVEIL